MRTDPVPAALPLNPGALRAFVEALGFGPGHSDGLPFWVDDAWVGPPDHWPGRWVRGNRFARLRDGIDPRYEGLEDEEVARAMWEAGRVPVGLAGTPEAVDSVFDEPLGAALVRVSGARTADGTAPIFAYSATFPHHLQVRARSLTELWGRAALARWELANGHPPASRALMLAPIRLDPVSLHSAAAGVGPGWRSVLGMEGDAPPRTWPTREPRVHGTSLPVDADPAAFCAAFTERWEAPRSCDREALEELLRPLRWAEPDAVPGWFDTLRAARQAAALRRPGAPASEREVQAGLVAVDAVLASQPLPHRDRHHPLDPIHAGLAAAASRMPAGSAVHAALSASGALAVARAVAADALSRLGDEHAEVLADAIGRMHPADQRAVLEALRSFPRHAGVIAVFDQVAATTTVDTLRRSATRWAGDLRAGHS